MRFNVENCMRNELPPRLRWFRDQLVTHLKEIRARALAGDTVAVVDEFLDCYRLDDNQCGETWRDIDTPTPPATE